MTMFYLIGCTVVCMISCGLLWDINMFWTGMASGVSSLIFLAITLVKYLDSGVIKV